LIRTGEQNLTVGSQGEELAANFLRRLRYRILERNYRCRCGEIDIVARQGETVVFVEVKTRRSDRYGSPALSVTPFKQRQIARAAQTWLAANRLADAAARFDVLSIRLREGEPPEIEHIANAFDLPA
jgi:putative endonuclease